MTKRGLTVIYPTISNPPTFGTIFALFNICDKYDKIYVVVRDIRLVMSPEQVKNMLEFVLCRYTPKFSVIISKMDFRHDTNITSDIPEFDKIITSDIDVYANLLSKGYKNINLISFPIGWDNDFHRIAYERSNMYTKLRNDIKSYPLVMKKKKVVKK